MRKLVVTLAIALASFSCASSCASTSNLSSVGKTTLYADEVVRDLGLFQSTAIALNDSNVLTQTDTKLVVTYVKTSVDTIGNTPNGWKATVNSGLDNLEKSLSAIAKIKLAQYFSTIRTVLALVQ